MVSIACTYVGRPSPTVTWYFNGRPYNKTQYTQTGLSKLELKGFTRKHIGTYQCVVSNKYKTISRSVMLTATGNECLVNKLLHLFLLQMEYQDHYSTMHIH